MDLRLPALQSGSQLEPIPVYDARRVLAGAAVVEILASPVKVAPVNTDMFRINA